MVKTKKTVLIRMFLMASFKILTTSSPHVFFKISYFVPQTQKKILESVISFCASCFYTSKSTFKSANELLQRLLTFSNIDFNPGVS